MTCSEYHFKTARQIYFEAREEKRVLNRKINDLEQKLKLIRELCYRYTAAPLLREMILKIVEDGE